MLLALAPGARPQLPLMRALDLPNAGFISGIQVPCNPTWLVSHAEVRLLRVIWSGTPWRILMMPAADHPPTKAPANLFFASHLRPLPKGRSQLKVPLKL